MSFGFRAVVTLFLFLSCSSVGQASTGSSDPKAIELIAGVAQALSTRSFEGIYTHEHSGQLETILVTKKVDSEQSLGRLEHLSGTAVPVIHRSSEFVCTTAGYDYQASQVFDVVQLSKNYRFHIAGDDRVAGREAITVIAEPRDQHRYAYHLAIDIDTLVPLRLALVANNRVLERFQFAEFTPLAENQAPTPSKSAADKHFVFNRGCISTQSRWQLGWTPPGFQLVAAKIDQQSDMLTFTDGFGRFSVFVTPSLNGKVLEGEAVRGSAAVFLDKTQAQNRVYQLSVVGEIPLDTAKRIATAVIPR